MPSTTTAGFQLGEATKLLGDALTRVGFRVLFSELLTLHNTRSPSTSNVSHVSNRRELLPSSEPTRRTSLAMDSITI